MKEFLENKCLPNCFSTLVTSEPNLFDTRCITFIFPDQNVAKLVAGFDCRTPKTLSGAYQVSACRPLLSVRGSYFRRPSIAVIVNRYDPRNDHGGRIMKTVNCLRI